MNIAICDDLSEERNILKVFLHRFEQKHSIILNIQEFYDTKDLLCSLEKGAILDVLFLDIFMDEQNGMDASKELREKDFMGEIIFTTVSKDYALESYDVAAAGYLHKPFSYNAFSKPMLRCLEKHQGSSKTTCFLSNRLEYTLFIKDILYIETTLRGCFVHVKDEILKTQRTLGSFEKEFFTEPCFLRIGKSYIVNLNQTTKNDNDFIYFKNGDKIALPVRNKQLIKKKIADFFWLSMKA